MQTLLIVDTFGYFFRNFYALPKLKSKDGFPTGVLVGFVNLINQLYNDNSSHIVFALEGEGDKVRKQIYPMYKANRQEADPDLIAQIKVAISWIKSMGLSSISINGYEADDVIASLCKLSKKEHIQAKIISVDKDLYQLIDENIYIYDPIKKKEIRENECFDKFGVYPKQFIDYQSLVGDSSDNIQGVSGIGAKSAATLIQHFGSLDLIYQQIDSIAKVLTPRLKDKLLEGRDSAYKSKELVRLRDDLLSSLDLDSMQKPMNNPLFLIKDEIEKYDIKILSKLSNSTFSYDKSHNKKLDSTLHFDTKVILNFNELLEVIDKLDSKEIAFDTETDSLDSNTANIVGFSFASNTNIGYYVPLRHNYLGVPAQISMENAKIALEKLFLNRTIIGHNIKFDLKILWHNFNLDINSYADSMILAWLNDSSELVNLDYQVKKIFSYETIKFNDIVKKDDNFSSVNIDIATKYAAQDSVCTLALYQYFRKALSSEFLDIAKNVEFPFIKILATMENNGIGIDKDYFSSLKVELNNDIENLAKRIYKLSNCEFNINSTKQLGSVLFDTLGLKKGRALKSSGYSTDEKTLEKLKDSHPIIPLLLEYRELSKLLSTYVVPILNLNKNDRIYTSFLQTGTSTGRLSSKNPNLQNIPVKTAIGRKIRKGFIAKSGYKFISADYSQIELRLLAHFSLDSSLLEAFRDDKDIHLETSSKIFGDKLAQEKRNIAKSINFGLIYGMGARKLSETLKIPQNEAKAYIESYFNSFPSVKEFLAKQEEEIIANGYAKTLLGRRRNFNFSNIENYEKLAFLREGINSIFQGSAADLIKLAMNKCFTNFKNRDVSLLLQVHDELIFEVKDSEVEFVKKEILDIMNNVYKLNVPLKCSLNVGSNWFSLK